MIDTKKFYDELIDLWNNYYNTKYVYDIIFISDDYIEVKCENKRIANEFADFIMAYYKAPICYDFRKGNSCYQFSISPSLMIRESKTSTRKSIKEERYNTEKSLKEYQKDVKDVILENKKSSNRRKSLKESKYEQGDLQKGDILKTNGYGIVYFVGDGSEFTDDSGEMFWGSRNEDDFEDELGGYYYYSNVVKVIGNVYDNDDEDW